MLRHVNVLMSKNMRVVVVCQQCPISPDKFSANQKSACIYLRRGGNRKERRHPQKAKTTSLVKENQCEWYKNDSLKKLDNGVNVLECTFS